MNRKAMNTNSYEPKSYEHIFLVVRKAWAHMKLQSLLERLHFRLWQEGMSPDTNANAGLSLGATFVWALGALHNSNHWFCHSRQKSMNLKCSRTLLWKKQASCQRCRLAHSRVENQRSSKISAHRGKDPNLLTCALKNESWETSVEAWQSLGCIGRNHGNDAYLLTREKLFHTQTHIVATTHIWKQHVAIGV